MSDEKQDRSVATDSTEHDHEGPSRPLPCMFCGTVGRHACKSLAVSLAPAPAAEASGEMTREEFVKHEASIGILLLGSPLETTRKIAGHFKAISAHDAALRSRLREAEVIGNAAKAEVGRLNDLARELKNQRDGESAQRRKAEEQVAEYEEIFAVQQTRMGEATALWRASGPGRELTLPDLGDLLTFLMDRVREAEDCAAGLARDLAAVDVELDVTRETRDDLERRLREAEGRAAEGASASALARAGKYEADLVVERAARQRAEKERGEARNRVAALEGQDSLLLGQLRTEVERLKGDNAVLRAKVERLKTELAEERKAAALDTLRAVEAERDILSEAVRDAKRGARQRAEREREELRAAWIAEDNEIRQVLGKALGYPPPPAAQPGDGVVTGPHTGTTLAQEAAERITALRAEVDRLKGLLHRDRLGLADAIDRMRKAAGGWAWIPAGAWGSYEWEERNEAALRREVGDLIDAVQRIGREALGASGDLAHAECCGAERMPDPIEALRAAITRLVEAGDWMVPSITRGGGLWNAWQAARAAALAAREGK